MAGLVKPHWKASGVQIYEKAARESAVGNVIANLLGFCLQLGRRNDVVRVERGVASGFMSGKAVYKFAPRNLGFHEGQAVERYEELGRRFASRSLRNEESQRFHNAILLAVAFFCPDVSLCPKLDRSGVFYCDQLKDGAGRSVGISPIWEMNHGMDLLFCNLSSSEMTAPELQALTEQICDNLAAGFTATSQRKAELLAIFNQKMDKAERELSSSVERPRKRG